MMSSRYARVIAGLLLSLLMFVGSVVIVGCSDGGDATDTTAAPGGATGGTLTPLATTTTLSVSMDGLSSFKSKDPFVPQAQVTTTTAPPTTTPTTAAPTTTAPPTTSTTVVETHELQVTAFWPDETISISLDDFNFSKLPEGVVLDGDWGAIEVTTINNVVAPYTVTFTRNGSVVFTLELNETQTW